MNSPENKIEHEFDISLKRCLNNWAEEQIPPNGVRRKVLRAAVSPPAKRSNLGRIIARFSAARISNFSPDIYGDLQSWMFARAMICSFETDIFAMKMVS